MNLKEAREAHGVTQLKVASDTDTSIPTVRIWEESDGRLPKNQRKRERLADYYARFERGMNPISRRAA